MANPFDPYAVPYATPANPYGSNPYGSPGRGMQSRPTDPNAQPGSVSPAVAAYGNTGYQGGGQFVGSSPYMQNVYVGGAGQSNDAIARSNDFQTGLSQGQQLFYNDPDMQALRDKNIDLSKGYNGTELGALRNQARGQIAGQRSQYMDELKGRSAAAGVGGARAAAMGAQADQGFQKNAADAEQKMALDNANLVRSGTQNLQDFLMKQKYGTLTTALGNEGLGTSDRAAQLGAQAQQGGSSGGFLSWLLG